MSIHQHLPPQARKQLKELGWAEGLELAKLALKEGQHFKSAIWLHKSRELPADQLRVAVERELTGKETEPWEIVYFKLYQSQIPVIDKAIEMAALMLGTDRSRGYCLEMICADFLAGANRAEAALYRGFIPVCSSEKSSRESFRRKGHVLPLVRGDVFDCHAADLCADLATRCHVNRIKSPQADAGTMTTN